MKNMTSIMMMITTKIIIPMSIILTKMNTQMMTMNTPMMTMNTQMMMIKSQMKTNTPKIMMDIVITVTLISTPANASKHFALAAMNIFIIAPALFHYVMAVEFQPPSICSLLVVLVVNFVAQIVMVRPMLVHVTSAMEQMDHYVVIVAIITLIALVNHLNALHVEAFGDIQ